MRTTKVKCRLCGYTGRLKLRKRHAPKPVMVPQGAGKVHNGNYYPNTLNRPPGDKFAAATGRPCPKCGHHKLRRVRRESA